MEQLIVGQKYLSALHCIAPCGDDGNMVKTTPQQKVLTTTNYQQQYYMVDYVLSMGKERNLDLLLVNRCSVGCP